MAARISPFEGEVSATNFIPREIHDSGGQVVGLSPRGNGGIL
jgi:hypothetical protein